MILNVYRKHPKKTLLFLMFLLGGVTFKFRVQLFNQFLQKMQSKLTKEMTLQMEKGQRINTILDKIQKTVEEYYQGKTFQNTVKGMLRMEQIQETSKQLKNPSKDLSSERVKTLYQELSNQFLIFEISTILLLRNHELLFLLVRIVFLTQEISEEQVVIINLLDEVQQLILKAQHAIIEDTIRKQIAAEPERFQYDGKINLKLLFKQMILLCKEKLSNFNWWPIVSESEIMQQKKFQTLNEFNSGNINQNLFIKTKGLVEKLIEINQAEATITFHQYSVNFSYQKFENRLNLLPNLEQMSELIFLKQLLTHHKIIKEEYYDQNCDSNNKKYYQKVIRQGMKIKEDDTLDDESESNVQLMKVIHEYKLFTMLEAAQNQIIRKILFGNELDEQGSSEKQSLGALLGGY